MTSPYGPWQGNPGQWSTATSSWPPHGANQHQPQGRRARAPVAILAVAASAVVLGIAGSARNIGDDTLPGVTTHDHGRGENRLYWTQLGMASAAIGVCNTFVASPDVVS